MENINTNLAEMRIEYTKGILDEHMVNPDPVKQFRIWFNEALSAQVNEPNIMTLSTVTAENRPTSRIVLLKDVTDHGFTFFTNYNSHKGKDMDHNPHVSILFMWIELQRQVRIEGRVSKLSEEDSVTYFDTRPIESRIGANISEQSNIIPNRQYLENAYNKLYNDYLEGKQITKPMHWGGYLIKPDYFEFWQGRLSRLHDRIVYTTDNGHDWKTSRLSP